MSRVFRNKQFACRQNEGEIVIASAILATMSTYVNGKSLPQQQNYLLHVYNTLQRVCTRMKPKTAQGPIPSFVSAIIKERQFAHNRSFTAKCLKVLSN